MHTGLFIGPGHPRLDAVKAAVDTFPLTHGPRSRPALRPPPPAVLSQVLGVGVKAATQWADAAGSSRTEYAASLSKSRRTDGEPNRPRPSD
jgi:hypothetical protein